MSSKPKYVGVKLEGPEHHAFGIISAKEGISKSAMLRRLVQGLISRKRKPQQAEEAA